MSNVTDTEEGKDPGASSLASPQGDAESPTSTPTVRCPFDDDQYPDGGAAAWLVVAGAWCCVLCSYGWINCMNELCG